MISLVATEEKLVTLPNITWEQFKGIESQLENNSDLDPALLLRYLRMPDQYDAVNEFIKTYGSRKYEFCNG